jgi:hypothetical protein
MPSVKVGKLAKVTLGTYTISELGQWSLDGITVDLLDASAFGDEFKTYVLGVGDYGTISFGGHFDMTDTTGQVVLDSAHRNKSAIANIRFYIDNTSYYTPNVTVKSDSAILMQTIRIAFEKYGIGSIDFTAKCTGPWVLV